MKQVNAFPGAMETFTVQNFKDLVPVYKAAESLEGKVDVEKTSAHLPGPGPEGVELIHGSRPKLEVPRSARVSASPTGS